MDGDAGGKSASNEGLGQEPERTDGHVEGDVRALRQMLDDCEQYLKEGETPAHRIERERRDTDAVLNLLIREKQRTEALRELLRSACAIAERRGAETAWHRFLASANALGVNGITARTYRVLPSDLEV